MKINFKINHFQINWLQINRKKIRTFRRRSWEFKLFFFLLLVFWNIDVVCVDFCKLYQWIFFRECLKLRSETLAKFAPISMDENDHTCIFFQNFLVMFNRFNFFWFCIILHVLSDLFLICFKMCFTKVRFFFFFWMTNVWKLLVFEYILR